MRTAIYGVAMALWAGAAWAGDAVEGVWKTLPDDNGNYGYVEIKPCGPAFCGTLIRTFDGSGAAGPTTNIGKQIVWDMVAQGGGYYADGQIWAPDRDKTYSSNMQVSGDGLSVSGCILGGLLCRAQAWSRVK